MLRDQATWDAFYDFLRKPHLIVWWEKLKGRYRSDKYDATEYIFMCGYDAGCNVEEQEWS